MAKTISSQASKEEGSTTIPKGSTAKWLEAQSNLRVDDIVYSAWKHAAVREDGQGINEPC